MRPWASVTEDRRRAKQTRELFIATADTCKEEKKRPPCVEYCGGVRHVNCTFIADSVEYILKSGK